MRLSVFDLGKLVRPRILAHTFLFETTEPQNFDRWWKNVRIEYKFNNCAELKNSIQAAYKKDLTTLFSGLALGDLSEPTEWQASYVARIESIIVLLGGIYYNVDNDQKRQQAIEIAKKQKIREDKIPVYGCSVSFHHGFKKAEEDPGSFEPLEPWFWNNGIEGRSYSWFYEAKQILSLESLINFESAEPGKVLYFKHTAGFLLTNEKLNKPCFYKTGSWTTRNLKIYNPSNKSYDRLNPNKFFKL